jgi:hypothetical protein
METLLTDINKRFTELETKNDELTSENVTLKVSLGEQENHSQRKNIRVVGIPEGTEGCNLTEFMASFLQGVLGRETFDRKTTARSPSQSNASPPILPPNLWFSRERGQLNYNGKRIHIFTDYSADLARRQTAYKDAKAHLHKAGVRFGLIHPAKLRITFQGANYTFEDPQSAITFVRDNIHSTAAQNPDP